ncbi:Ig-like domain-containing protein [Sporolactobacillus terrae]|nr:Ig-like domain-containing protein [Sporolactobacillus terrae]UAK16361.1 glucosaminidase domain-containing protein [Sporolactobacillus terrae]
MVKLAKYFVKLAFISLLIVIGLLFKSNVSYAESNTSLKAMGFIDDLSNGSIVTGIKDIHGWFLDGSIVDKIDVMVDGDYIDRATYGLSRPDVGNRYPDYQNNNSGFNYNLNTRILSNGIHTVTFRETGKNGEINDQSIRLNIQNPSAMGFIDDLSNGSIVYGIKEIHGWFLDSNTVDKIDVLIDGNYRDRAIYGLSRPDVGQTYPIYGNNNAGFKYTLNTRALSNGIHTITFRETGRNGKVKDESVRLNIQNPPAIGFIDDPTEGSKVDGTKEIQGWFLDGSIVDKIDVMIDGAYKDRATYGISRPDVGRAFPAYDNNNAGFRYYLDTRVLTNGKHQITFRETGRNGKIKDQSVQLNVENPSAKGFIDDLNDGAQIQGIQTFRGWYLDGSIVDKIDVMIDGQYRYRATYGKYRPDVGQAFKEYHNNYAGFDFKLDTQELGNGWHTITFREAGRNGAINDLNIRVNIKNIPAHSFVDLDLKKASNISLDELINYVKPRAKNHPSSIFNNDGILREVLQSAINAEKIYGVNAQYLIAHAIWESGWGESSISKYKHNLFGYGAYDANPFNGAYYFPTYQEGIYYVAYKIRSNYLEENGPYYWKSPTLEGMNHYYATDNNWSNGIAGVMKSIKPFNTDYYASQPEMITSSVNNKKYGSAIPVGQPRP